jgi:predicted transposase YbfD/YdcC
MLGQVKTSWYWGNYKTRGKGHEIAGIKELLLLLDIKGIILSIDAIGCEKEIASLIVEKQADYILAVKDNQEQLQKDITSSFAVMNTTEVFEQIEKNNGRIETRKCSVLTNLKMMETKAEWAGIRSILQIESKRRIGDKEQTQVRYYIRSLATSAEAFNQLIRSHWGIENSLHWVLDMNFDEEKSRKQKGYYSLAWLIADKSTKQ